MIQKDTIQKDSRVQKIHHFPEIDGLYEKPPAPQPLPTDVVVLNGLMVAGDCKHAQFFRNLLRSPPKACRLACVSSLSRIAASWRDLFSVSTGTPFKNRFVKALAF